MSRKSIDYKEIGTFFVTTLTRKNKDLYYDALSASQHGWHEGTENIVPFVKYLPGTILTSYKDFEEHFSLIETKLSALKMVKLAGRNRIGHFNNQGTLSDSWRQHNRKSIQKSDCIRRVEEGRQRQKYILLQTELTIL